MTTNGFNLNSDWVSPPGKTIEDFIDEQNKSISDFAHNIQCKVGFLKKLLKGSEAIDVELANKLEYATGASTEFWLSREAQYRESIERQKVREENEKSWLSQLPTADMTKFDWIASITNRKEKIRACLDYFNVSSVEEWQNKYEGMLAETAFRTSPIYSSRTESVITWLRQGEILAECIECNNWNKKLLIESIPKIRELTNIADPDVFIPKLTMLLASCGVAFAVVRAPNGCRASGATYWLNKNKALVILSFRYLSDDHFWFTLFHEIGHLIMHSDHSLIIESADIEKSDIEREADEFSENILIPEKYQSELYNFNSKDLRPILKFAKKIGVSKGIIVGQMQHKDIISKKHLNKLKTRYSWN